jgi:futalosine hydrolase
VPILVVTAVGVEREALEPNPELTVLVGGVGPAAAAAATSAALARDRFDLVISAGIGGGFAPLRPGDIAVADTIVFADLGAESADGFLGAADLGVDAVDTYPVPPRLAVELVDRAGGHLGAILTVATVTGTSTLAEARQRRFPDAVAEGMEGAGVAAAARLHGVPVAEIRAISNVVGPRDRSAWQVPEALAALRRAMAGLGQSQ